MAVRSFGFKQSLSAIGHDAVWRRYVCAFVSHSAAAQQLRDVSTVAHGGRCRLTIFSSVLAVLSPVGWIVLVLGMWK